MAVQPNALPYDYELQETRYEPIVLDDCVAVGTKLKVDWLAAKQYYLSSVKISYADVASKYGVSLKQVKKHGAQENWVLGRQRVANLADIHIQESHADNLECINEQHLALYRQAQELVSLYLSSLQAELVAAEAKATAEDRIVSQYELPHAANLLHIVKALTLSINGERACLGLPTAITGVRPAPTPGDRFNELTVDELRNFIAETDALLATYQTATA